MGANDTIVRPAYEMNLCSGLVEAANMLAAEAAAERRVIERPFNGLAMKAWPGITGAQVVVDWQYGLGCRRETKQRAERDALRTRAEAAEQRAEAAEAALAQARADRALMTGLWLATVPPDVLPTLLPADPGDRDRLVAALDAVDLQSGTASHTAAARAVIARIVAETAGGAR
jgi:hypothetical protein